MFQQMFNNNNYWLITTGWFLLTMRQWIIIDVSCYVGWGWRKAGCSSPHDSFWFTTGEWPRVCPTNETHDTTRCDTRPPGTTHPLTDATRLRRTSESQHYSHTSKIIFYRFCKENILMNNYYICFWVWSDSESQPRLRLGFLVSSNKWQ